MRHALSSPSRGYQFVRNAALIAVIFVAGSTCQAQTTPTEQPTQIPWSQDLDKYPGLLPELGLFAAKLQHNVQFPQPRAESHLLPLLPQSTVFYAAFPNYGDAAYQALGTLREELRESSVLRDWWEHGELAAAGPKVEDALEKFYQVHQYLGQEIVLSGAMEGQEAKVLVVAEIQKPGLKKFLQEMVQQLAAKPQPGVRVLDLQELAAARDSTPAKELVVLVRSDFVIGAFDLATLRSFNAQLHRAGREFASAPFGKRVAQEYQGGVTVLAAADMQRVLSQLPPAAKQDVNFQNSGFADMKYLVWEHKNVASKPVSQMELSFSAPRHGAAAWLANSSQLGSLDFVSPGAIMSGTVMLKNPAQIFQDVKDLASLSNPNAFAALPVFEQALGVSLKDDILSLLGGELTVELDSANPPQPVWRAMLGVKDANRLQRTLNTLLTASHFQADQVRDGDITYYRVQIPSPKATIQIGYAFVDGYLVLGSSRDAVVDAVRLHRSGGSLAKSRKFLEALPPGRSLSASALLYQDPIAATALRLQQIAPGLADALTRYRTGTNPAVVGVYGDETAIREESTSSAFDAGAFLTVAAIAVPALVRSKIAANEASAVGTLRAVNTAQVVYATTYQQRGYAPSLAALGRDPRGAAESPDHADLLDPALAGESCSADGWCTKAGFRFRIMALCKQRVCKEYVLFAAPINENTGTRSFCSTSDGVIRFKLGPTLTGPLSVPECKSWPPLQ